MIKRLLSMLIFILLLLTVGCTITLTYNISGVVVDENQQPVANATVQLDTQQLTLTNQAGEFDFLAVPEGYRNIQIEKSGYLTKSTQIKVDENSRYFSITLKKETVQGDYFALINILNPLGDPIESAVSTLRVLSTNTVVDTKTGGSVTFYLNSGTYRLDVTAPNYQPYSTTFTITEESIEKNVQPEPLPASISGNIQITNSYASRLRMLQNLQKTAQIASLPKLRNTKKYDGLLVQFYEDIDETSADAILTKAKSPKTTVKKKQAGLYKLDITKPGELDAVMTSLKKSPDVKHVQLNYLNELLSTGVEPNDPNYYSQWNLALIGMPEAWLDVKGSNGDTIVAVLDTGIRYHADLDSNIVDGYDSVDNDGDPTDDVTATGDPSHGTHVASIIGAVTNNANGMAGVGWNLKVMPVKVFRRNNDGSLGATDGDIAEGIRWAVDHGADVINLSLGGPVADPVEHPVVEDALKYATDHNVTVIAASGNASQSTLFYPAYSTYTLAVGAVGSDGIRASYSNYGERLDITAPGGHGGLNVWANWIMGYVDSANPRGMSGTSQAAPHVAAVAGLLYNMGITDPALVTDYLLTSATTAGSTTEYGAGILNASEAIALAVNNQTTESLVRIYAAASEDQYTWYVVNEVPYVYPDNDGDYTITGLPTYYDKPIYLLGWYDVDQDGMLSDGDYYGYSAQAYTLTPNQHISGVNFTVSLYFSASYLASTGSKNVKPVRIYLDK